MGFACLDELEHKCRENSHEGLFYLWHLMLLADSLSLLSDVAK